MPTIGHAVASGLVDRPSISRLGAVADQAYGAIVETLESYWSLDELKELIWRYGHRPGESVALKRFEGVAPKRTVVLKCRRSTVRSAGKEPGERKRG